MSYSLQSCLPVSCLHAAVLGIILWEKGAKTSIRKLVCEDVVKYICSLCLKMKDNMHRFSTWIYSYLRLRCMKNWFQVYTCCRLVLFLIMTCYCSVLFQVVERLCFYFPFGRKILVFMFFYNLCVWSSFPFSLEENP